MSWSIGLHLGESVVEIAGRDTSKPDNAPIKFRGFLSHGSAEQTLAQFFSNNGIERVSVLKIASQLPLKIIEAGHGTPAAMLTTAGFENWLEMTLSLKTSHFTTKPKRHPFLIDRELIFGIGERTNAQGQIERAVDESELEFLVAKLELHGIKHVAVCYLHSHLNRENEEKTRDYLTSRGFQVHVSSTCTSPDEKIRFWTTALNTYVAPYYLEKLKGLADEIAKVATPEAKIQLGDYALKDVLEGRVAVLDTAFSFSDHLGRSFALTSPLLYCGLEEILYFKPASEPAREWKTFVGTIEVKNWPYLKPRVQPLTKFGKGFFCELALTNKRISFDPGPIVFGRGLIPCVFDLFDDLQDVSGVSEKIKEKGRARLNETLAAYARNRSDGSTMTHESLREGLKMMTAANLRNECRLGDDFTLCGPLAPAVQKLLGGKVFGDDFFTVTSLMMESV